MRSSDHRAAIILLLFANLVLAACLPQTDRQIPPGTVEATEAPTAISSPEPTLSVTPTPIVSFDGPKLLYQTYLEGSPAVYIMNFDGTGKKKLALPPDFHIRFLEKAISPDGKWLAFHTGSEENKNIALNLFSLETGESILTTPLLSPDYPDNFQSALERLQASQQDFFNKGEITSATLKRDFDLTMVSWSPDGRFLAFAGELDGPTSDLYLYDMESKTIRRMFDDLLNIASLEWASDGQTIFFSNIVPGEIYSWTIPYAINVKNGDIQDFDVAGWDIIDSCFESEFCLWHYQGDGGDPISISYLDVATGKSRSLWKPTFQDYAASFQDKLIIVSGPYGEDPEPGTYFVDFAGKRKKISDIFFERFVYWDAEEPCFIGAMPDGLYRISLDGTVQKIFEPVYYEFSISPDGQWLIAYNEDSPYVHSQGLLLLNDKLEVVQIIGDEKTNHLVWQPDSAGLLFMTRDLYHVSVPDGQLQLIEKGTNVSLGEYDYRWIP